MSSFKELGPDHICLCGSEKEYGDCCINKNFRYGVEGENYIKNATINDPEFVSRLKEMKKTFFDYYGREPDGNDFIFSFLPHYSDDMLYHMINILREAEVPEDKIYAYYKSDGLLPTAENLDSLSEKDLEEFESLCEEYNRSMEAEIKDTVNSIQHTVLSNSYIEEHLQYAFAAIKGSLHDLINRHREQKDIRSYRITTELEYCMFSALKTIRTLESIVKLREENLSECIYALSRSVFENYMYICSINADKNLFKEKLLPKVDEENYAFETYPDGRINYNKVVAKKTGTKKSIKVTISDLKEKLPHGIDRELYAIFYQNACQYVHVDIMSAKSYFSDYDPYDEIDPTLIAMLIVSVLSTILLLQISLNREIQPQYRKDVHHLYMKIKPKVISCLTLAGGDPEHSNAIFDVLLKRLEIDKLYE